MSGLTWRRTLRHFSCLQIPIGIQVAFQLSGGIAIQTAVKGGNADFPGSICDVVAMWFGTFGIMAESRSKSQCHE
jgi:arginine exporter protein ArgO